MQRAIELHVLLCRTRLLAIAIPSGAAISPQDWPAAVVVPEAIQQVTDLRALRPECRRRVSPESFLHLELLGDRRWIGLIDQHWFKVAFDAKTFLVLHVSVDDGFEPPCPAVRVHAQLAQPLVSVGMDIEGTHT